jgi:hypothetical protein
MLPAMNYPSPRRDRANLSMDGSSLRPRRRGNLRPERSGAPAPIARFHRPARAISPRSASAIA